MTPPSKHPLRLRGLALLAAVASLLAGCGEERADPRAAAVAETIEAFAGATGARACDLLSPAALDRLYGGRSGCIERSRAFQAGQVEVEEVGVGRAGNRAIAEARSLGGRQRFRIVAVLVPPPGCEPPCRRLEWRVDEVVPLGGQGGS
jgi:hypothetical protein